MRWMLLVLLYGVLKGAREIVKKKALSKGTVMEVLVLYTLLSFLMVLPGAGEAGGLKLWQYGAVLFKSFVIFVAWICSFLAIKKLPISLYGVLDLSRVLFATLLGVCILQETMTGLQIAGLIFVCIGLLLLKTKKADGSEKVSARFVCLALLSCMLNGLSGMMDKILMKDMTSTQLQFWYMLFLVLFYLLYVCVKRIPIRFRSLLTNYWVWILSLMFVIADKALFEANAMAESRVTIMTLIKQSGCIVTILGGRIFFQEKNIRRRLLCAGIIVLGIVLGVLSTG